MAAAHHSGSAGKYCLREFMEQMILVVRKAVLLICLFYVPLLTIFYKLNLTLDMNIAVNLQRIRQKSELRKAVPPSDQ